MTLSGLIVKAVGLFFKLPLTSLIGEEGMGYFNGAYTIFTWLYTLSVAGLPTAISMMIARLPEKQKAYGSRKIFSVSILTFSIIGFVSSLLLGLFSGAISHLMRVELSRTAILAISPCLFFVAVSASLRGYFQGIGKFRWQSISQIIEALGKLTVGISLAGYAIKSGMKIPFAAAYAATGITFGVGIGALLLLTVYYFSEKPKGELHSVSRRDILSRLFRASLPITLSSSIMSLTGLIDSFVMTRSLNHAGFSQAETAAIWGNYSSLAVPIFNLPPVLTLPIAYSLLPSLASSLSLDNLKNSINITAKSVRQTALISIPCSLGMATMSLPILKLLFEDGIAQRGALQLTILAPASMLLCFVGLTNTILQAYGYVKIPLYAMLIGALSKIVSTIILTEYIGKYATPVSTLICYLTVTIISVTAISTLTPLKSSFKISYFIKPLIISVVSLLAGSAVYTFAGTVISILITAVLYFIILYLCGGLKD